MLEDLQSLEQDRSLIRTWSCLQNSIHLECWSSAPGDRRKEARVYRMLVVVDELTRECLTIRVARKLPSWEVIEALAGLFLSRGLPTYIHSDNGPGFTARAVREWLGRLQVAPLFIEPGSPWENGYVESFNARLRDESVDGEILYTLEEVQVLTERWRWQYNHVRPHQPGGHTTGDSLTCDRVQTTKADQARA